MIGENRCVVISLPLLSPVVRTDYEMPEGYDAAADVDDVDARAANDPHRALDIDLDA